VSFCESRQQTAASVGQLLLVSNGNQVSMISLESGLLSGSREIDVLSRHVEGQEYLRRRSNESKSARLEARSQGMSKNRRA
jgi:hypothetical protein